MSPDLQRFKDHDPNELKVINSGMPVLDQLGSDRDAFYEAAFTTEGLGEVLYDLKADAISSVIDLDVYRKSYPAIHNLFTRPGTFEYYLDLFRAIWGEDVEITFTVPAGGVLQINAKVLNVATFNLIARQIQSNQYQYNHLVDRSGNRLSVRDLEGTKSQDQIDKLAIEISPNGIYVTITLVQ